MTSDDGWVERIDASEPTAQHDDLEHWLHGIRTDLTDDAPDWAATASADASAEAPGDAEAEADAEADAQADAPAAFDDDTGSQTRGEQTVGRHRAED